MSKPWSDSTKRVIAIAMALMFLFILLRFSAIIPPLVVAVVIAYVLTPIVDVLHRRTPLPRFICILLADLAFLIAIVAIPAIAAPILIEEVRQVNVDLQPLLESVERALEGHVSLLGLDVELASVYDQARRSLDSMLSPVVSRSVFFLLDVVSGFLWGVFVFVGSFYLMRDWHRIGEYIHGLVPADYRCDFERLMDEIAGIWNAFLRGELVLILVIGAAVSVCTAVVGLSNWLILGLIAGLLEVIPNVGPVVAAIPAVVLALIRGSSWIPLGNFWFAMLVIGLYTLIQQVENNLLVPRIIGRSVRLHPMVVLVGAIAGARLAGILGILLAAPVLATARVVLGYTYRKLQDLDPFPSEPEREELTQRATSVGDTLKKARDVFMRTIRDFRARAGTIVSFLYRRT